MVSLVLEFGRQRKQWSHRGKEDRRRFGLAAGTHHTPDALGEEQRGAVGGHPRETRRARDVDALADHAHAHRHALGARRECGDLVAGLRVVRQDQHRAVPRDLLDDCGVRACVVLIAGQHKAGCIGHAGLTQVGDPLVHRRDHVWNPFASWIQGGAPGRRLGAFGGGLGERRGDHLACAVAPPRRPRVGGEDDGTHHCVPKGFAVAVGEVGRTAPAALAVGVVADERDPLVGSGSKRRAREAQSACCGFEGCGDRVAPGQPVTRMVHFVQDHQAAPRGGARRMQRRLGRHLCVGRHVPAQVGAHRPDGVGEGGVQVDSGGGRSIGPLRAQVVGGADDDHPIDRSAGQQPVCDGQRQGGLAGSRSRGDEEVTPRVLGVVRRQGGALPGAQRTVANAGNAVRLSHRTPFRSSACATRCPVARAPQGIRGNPNERHRRILRAGPGDLRPDGRLWAWTRDGCGGGSGWCPGCFAVPRSRPGRIACSGLSAEAAFWQLLSLPSLFLALVATLGYVSRWFGLGTPQRTEHQRRDDVEPGVQHAGRRAGDPPDAARGAVRAAAPTSSASASSWRCGPARRRPRRSSTPSRSPTTCAICAAPVRSRLLALWLFLGSVLVGVIVLPLLVLGPGLCWPTRSRRTCATRPAR